MFPKEQTQGLDETPEAEGSEIFLSEKDLAEVQAAERELNEVIENLNQEIMAKPTPAIDPEKKAALDEKYGLNNFKFGKKYPKNQGQALE